MWIHSVRQTQRWSFCRKLWPLLSFPADRRNNSKLRHAVLPFHRSLGLSHVSQLDVWHTDVSAWHLTKRLLKNLKDWHEIFRNVLSLDVTPLLPSTFVPSTKLTSGSVNTTKYTILKPWAIPSLQNMSNNSYNNFSRIYNANPITQNLYLPSCWVVTEKE